MKSQILPKVLVACPTYKGKAYCLDAWAENVKSFTYLNYDVLLVDNTNDDGEHAQEIRDRTGFTVIHHYNKDAKTINYIMAECNEEIRKYFLENDYDYLFSLESDVFPKNKDIIQKFINYNLPIVSGWYHIGDPGYSYPLIQVKMNHMNLDGTTGYSIRQLYWEEIIEFLDGHVNEVFACGIGCTLIHRGILEKVRFRISEYNPYVHADSIFYLDLANIGIKSYLDTAEYCDHDRTDRKEGVRHGKRNVEEFGGTEE
jgi:hypothetical protein